MNLSLYSLNMGTNQWQKTISIQDLALLPVGDGDGPTRAGTILQVAMAAIAPIGEDSEKLK